jgi:8-oxo-dGTP pyrophosphatase MutT (NUDIX family)
MRMSGNMEHRVQTAGPPDAAGKVVRIARCDLRVTAGSWAFAQAQRDVIDAHWERRRADNPAFFNGDLYLMVRHALDGGVFSAQFIKTDFKSFLYWRETGAPDRSVADGFGSALIRSAEGHVILGQQRPGNVNGGLTYLPSGFIDGRDVAADGTIDIDASIARELAEETGLVAAALERAPGFVLTFMGSMVSIAAEYRSHLEAEQIRTAIRRHIAADPDPELADAVVVRSAHDLAGLGMPAYAGVLLAALFQGA